MMPFTEELLRASKRRQDWKYARLAIAKMLLADPIASNASIAAETNTHKATVRSVREQLEASDEIPIFNERRGVDGRVWGRRRDARRVTPFWLREALEDSISMNVDMLVELRDVLVKLENRIKAQSALLGEIRNGRYRLDQPATPRMPGREETANGESGSPR